VIAACAISMLIVRMDWFALILALSTGAGSASHFSGRLAERFPADRLMAIGMLISAVGMAAMTSLESLWLYTPLFMLTGIALGLGWALAGVATRAVVPAQFDGAASGITPTALGMLGALGTAIAAAMLEPLAGSVAAAGADAAAINTVLRAGAVLAFAGAIALLSLGHPRTPVVAPVATPAG
jgi:sugar phosphate permease